MIAVLLFLGVVAVVVGASDVDAVVVVVLWFSDFEALILCVSLRLFRSRTVLDSVVVMFLCGFDCNFVIF